MFGMLVHLRGIRVKFVCEGDPVKVKVTGAKRVSASPDPTLNFGCLDLECSFWSARTFFKIAHLHQGY